MISASPWRTGRSRACARGRPAARRRGDLVGLLAPQGGHLVGTAQRLEAGDGGVGHVDPVRGPERLGQDVADAGHLEDGPGGAAGDDAGPGAAGLSMTRPAPLSPMTGCTMVVPASGTSNRFLRASSMPFCTARPASLALP
jgi:hypothetical protein